MTAIEYTENFVEDMLSVQLQSKRDEIFASIDILASSPEIGSRIIHPSLKQRFGTNIRKMVISPFDVFYRYLPEADIVIIEGLLHQRRIH